jgi:hypothetical protein
MERDIVQLVEAYNQKFNPSDTSKGLKTAHREIGKAVKGLLEAKKITPESINLRALYEALVVEQELEENLTSSAFPNIAGQIISKVMIDGYQSFPKDHERLVRTVPSKLKVSRVVGWNAIGSVGLVTEKQDYPEITPPDEKFQTVNNYKYGGKLSLTKEDIFFDQTGELMNRARQIGERAQQKRASLIFAAVVDSGNTSLSGSTLYSASAPYLNLSTSNPLGTDGWEAVRKKLIDKTDENGEPIWVLGDRPLLMVTSTLLALAEKLQKNEYGPQGTANLDVNLARNQFDVIVNPYGHAIATDWYYGAPNRQFRWEEVWPFEVFTRVGQDTEEGFNADVIQQFKASFYGGAGAADWRYWIKNQA